MRTLNVNEAVWEIANAGEEEQECFFFLVGAGVSAPEIPTARWIADDCRQKAIADRPELDAELVRPGDALERYSYWFERAYPQPRQRQIYLQNLIDGSRISHGLMRLAHVLSTSAVSSLVVTPNFDEGLERALGIFDVPFLVCDHPATVERIDPDRRTVQIVHVHGTYWFYDCCNLRGEIANRAELETSSQSMQSLLDRFLANRSPIVLGYSGWESDVFMTALKRRMSGRLPYNLYWFCYSRGEVDRLPSWLKEHQDCVVVVPEEAEQDDGESDEGQTPEDKRSAVLPAASVLETLIRECDLDPPLAITNPTEALLGRLRMQLPSLGLDEESEDIYQLESVLETLRRLSGDERSGSAIEQARDAMRRSEYDRVVDIALEAGAPSDEWTSLLATALPKSKRTTEEKLHIYPLVIDKLRTASSDGSPQRRLALGTALLAYGRLLGRTDFDQGIALLDEVVRLASTSSSGPSFRQMVRAIDAKVVVHARAGDWQSALDCLNQVLEMSRSDSGLRHVQDLAISNKGIALRKLGRFREAVDYLERAETDSIHSSPPRVVWQIRRARLRALSDLGDEADATAYAAHLVSLAEEDPDLPSSADSTLALAAKVLEESTWDAANQGATEEAAE